MSPGDVRFFNSERAPTMGQTLEFALESMNALDRNLYTPESTYFHHAHEDGTCHLTIEGAMVAHRANYPARDVGRGSWGVPFHCLLSVGWMENMELDYASEHFVNAYPSKRLRGLAVSFADRNSHKIARLCSSVYGGTYYGWNVWEHHYPNYLKFSKMLHEEGI